MERTRILQAVASLSKYSELDDEALASELSNAGFSAVEASALVSLVPIAFSRPLLESLGISNFASSISVPTRAGSRVDIPLEELSLYAEALAIAREHYRSGILNHEDYKRITLRSAEVNAVNKALNEGEDVKGAAIASVLIGPCAEDLEYNPPIRTSWWKRFFYR